MRKAPRSRRASALVASLSMLAATACVHQKSPGVGVKPLQADVVFGVKPPTADQVPAPNLGELAAPAQFASSPRRGAQLADEGADETTVPKRHFVVPLATKQPCPAALQNAFPEKEASPTPAGPPDEGLYRWKKGGSATYSSLPGQTFPIGGFESRIVRRPKVNATSTNPNTGATNIDYSFETVQPTGDGSGGVTVTGWRVQTNPTSVNEQPNDTNARISGGDPERGIVLKSIQKLDSKGNTVSAFSFSPGLLMLPLPVSQGETFSSVAVDTKSGNSIQLQGTVTKRNPVDACGDEVDGWQIDATRTFSGPDFSTFSGSYSYELATQLGGILIFEKFDDTNPGGTAHREFTLGQLHPSPVPEDSK